MSKNSINSRGFSDIEITPEIIVREIERARHLHDDAVVAYAGKGVNGVARAIGAFGRYGRAVLKRFRSRGAQRESMPASQLH